jgi:hypothetical protein
MSKREKVVRAWAMVESGEVLPNSVFGCRVNATEYARGRASPSSKAVRVEIRVVQPKARKKARKS